MLKTLYDNNKFIPANTLVVGVDIGKVCHKSRGITSSGQFITKQIYSFKNTMEDFNKFYDILNTWMLESGSEKILVGMEPTGPYWIPLALHLEKKGIEVVLINPYHVKRSKEFYDNSPGKSDSKDALLIARLVREGKYLNRTILSDKEENISETLSYHEVLLKERTGLINKIRNKLSEYFPEFENMFKNIDGKTVINLLKVHPLPCDIINLGEIKLIKFLSGKSRGRFGLSKAKELLGASNICIGKQKGLESARYVISCLAKRLEEVINEKKNIKLRLKELMEDMEVYHVLNSIPCVSTITIASMISAVGDMRRYNSAGEILKKLGLNVYEISSGKRKGQRHISKRGRGCPRAKLYESAVLCSRKGGIFHDKYVSMTDRGIASPKAYVALTCKLVKIMFAILKNGESFDKDLMCGKAEKTGPAHISMMAA